jgi:hypothetical protein
MLGQIGIEKTKLEHGSRAEGYFLQTFIVRRLGYLLALVSVCLFVGAFVAQERISAGMEGIADRDDLLSRKQRNVDMKNRELKMKHKELSKKDEEISENLELLGRTKRTLDLKNGQLLAKHREFEEAHNKLAELSATLGKKQRTIDWKNEILEAKIKLANDQAEVASGARKNLFRVTRLKNLSERSLHEKILKVLSALQGFLQRQQIADSVVQHAKLHIDTAVGAHKKSTKKLLDLLGEETGRTMKDAHEALEDSTSSLHKVLNKVLGHASEEIADDAKHAKTKLKLVVQDMLEELKEEEKFEEEANNAEKTMHDEGDATYKEFEEEWDKEKHPEDSNDDMKENMKMLVYVKNKILASSVSGDLDEESIKKGQKIVDEMNSGDRDYEEAQADIAKFMQKYDRTPKYDEQGKEFTDLAVQLELLLVEARFSPQKSKYLAGFERWEKSSEAEELTNYHSLFGMVEVGRLYMDTMNDLSLPGLTAVRCYICSKDWQLTRSLTSGSCRTRTTNLGASND